MDSRFYFFVDVFDRAIGTKVAQQDVNQIILLILARASYEKRQLEAGDDGTSLQMSHTTYRMLCPLSIDEDRLPMLIGLLEMGIAMARQASKTIDPTLRLEKFLASVVGLPTYSEPRLVPTNWSQYENSGLVDEVFDVWKAAAKHSKSSYQVWLNYTESLM